jgi:proteasome lid subunit RPN8/RPN11
MAKTRTSVKVQPAVVMESEVARKIRQHARSSMKAEVCGVLIGTAENERTAVEACIAGINAAQGGTHVTFTQDTWEHIYKIKDREFPDDKIVGWYHSHPGFGVFLSEHDMFIQENFFSGTHQIAWVYDPHTDEEGCFGWINGKVEKLSGIRFGYLQSVDQTTPASAKDDSDAESTVSESNFDKPAKVDRETPALVRWTGPALICFAIALLSAAAGYVFGGRQVAGQFEHDVAPTLEACQQIAQHPVEACREILQQLAPPLSGSITPADTPGQSKKEDKPAQKQVPAGEKGNNGQHK